MGEELSAGYFNGKRVKFKTYAELFNDENIAVTSDGLKYYMSEDGNVENVAK